MMKKEQSTSIPSAPSGATQSHRSEPPIKDGMKIKGTLTVVNAEAHDYEFRAQRSTGVSTQREVKRAGMSKLYETVGERQRKLVAHLSIPADSPDPAADLNCQLQRLTRDMATKQQPKLRGRTLLNQPDTRIVLNEKSRELECVINIKLEETNDIQGTLIKHLQTISTCLAINQHSLLKQKN